MSSFSKWLTPLTAALASYCLLLSLSVRAVEVEDLYQARVIVDSRNDERQRITAFSTAMREVLVKVTGRDEVLGMNSVRRALAAPQTYVESWAYRTLPGISQQQPDQVIELEVTFFEPEILRLLNNNGIPVWPSNRPVTLVWVVAQDELGGREIISSGMQNPLATTLMERAEARGLPLRLPLIDFEDLQHVSATDIWNFDLESVREASRRYQAESMLVIRIYRALSGEQLGRSVYLFRDQVLSQDIYENNMSDFIEIPVEMLATELSAYYGVLLSGTSSRVVVRMTVNGINDAGDYAGLMKYVAGLADVNSTTISSVRQETIDLELVTGGQIRQLVETIALDNNLLPLSELVREGDEVLMHYRWSGQ